MGEDKQKTTNISIRLPDEYRKRLQLQADKKGISFNAHTLRVLEIHLMNSGFGPISLTSTTTNRLFQLRCEPYVDNVDETTWAFFIDEPKFEKERAYYVIGIGRTVLRDWQVKDKATVAKEVGLAMLNFYNRSGMEIDRSGLESISRSLITMEEECCKWLKYLKLWNNFLMIWHQNDGLTNSYNNTKRVKTSGAADPNLHSIDSCKFATGKSPNLKCHHVEKFEKYSTVHPPVITNL